MRFTVDATTLKVAVVVVTIALFFWLTGCAAPPTQTITVEKPVLIPGPATFVPIPADLLVGCAAPAPAGPTNGDLMIHDNAETAYAKCLSDRLDAIKALK
jgi:hypothetical protein